MATITIKYRPSTVVGREGTLYYQLIHRRQVRQLRTPCKLHPEEWNPHRQCVLIPPDSPSCRKLYLEEVQQWLQEDGCRLRLTILRLEREHRPYTADELCLRLAQEEPSAEVTRFVAQLIEEKRTVGQEPLARKYTACLRSFARFLGDRTLLFREIDAPLLQAYQNHLKSRGLCLNTISFYMRGLRAIYNQAVARGLSPQQHPFQAVYTGIAKTVKRALPLSDIHRIKQADLSEEPTLALARDLFLFSFYTRGMSFVDMAHLQKSDLRHGLLVYRRRKTGQLLHIRWEPVMQEIVDRYARPDSPYLLPILTTTEAGQPFSYLKVYHRINQGLKQLGERLHLPLPLTTYVSRHSWASIARSRQVPIVTISEALGHDNETTTRIYLSTLDTTEVDRVNRKILASLK